MHKKGLEHFSRGEIPCLMWWICAWEREGVGSGGGSYWHGFYKKLREAP